MKLQCKLLSRRWFLRLIFFQMSFLALLYFKWALGKDIRVYQPMDAELNQAVTMPEDGSSAWLDSKPRQVNYIPNFLDRKKRFGVQVTEYEYQFWEEGVSDESLGFTEVHVAGSEIKPQSTASTLRPLTRVAVGLAVSPARNLSVTSPLFRSLLPSFCRTASSGYNYHFFLAFDYEDPVVMFDESTRRYIGMILRQLGKMCSKRSGYTIHFIRCHYGGKPAWSQNDAMLQAYILGMDYFYRVNDDSALKSKGWTSQFIRILSRLDPPNVGVAGPTHDGGKSNILTYDFVHRSHIDMFGYYYPRCYSSWYADGWISKLYRAGRRAVKIRSMRMNHTRELGRRYRVDTIPKSWREYRIRKDRLILQRYTDAITKGTTPRNSSKVISMYLRGNDSASVWGAVRNAQLLPVIFPGWAMRIYVKPNSVPEVFLKLLRSLFCQIIDIKDDGDVAPGWSPEMAMFYLTADDPSVEMFLVRSPRGRFTSREAWAVREWWRKTGTACHVIRDHHSHVNRAIVENLFGCRTRKLCSLLGGKDIKNFFRDCAGTNKTSFSESGYLNKCLYPIVKDDMLSHDSVSCEKWSNSIPLPSEESKTLAYIGCPYSAHEEPMVTREDNELTIENAKNTSCLL